MERRLTMIAIALAAFSSLLLFSGRSSLAQATFTVNSTADPGVGVCDATECTLREAIDAANVTLGPDTIVFNPVVFPAAAPAIISVTSELPAITEALTIDCTGAGVVLQPAVPVVPTGLFVQDTDITTDTGFTLIGNSFTIQGFENFGIFVCGWDGVSPEGCGTGPISGVNITGSSIAADVTAIVIRGDSHSNISIDSNTSITGGGPGSGVSIEGAVTNTDISVSGNGPISGGFEGVTIQSDSNSNVSISDNDSITGDLQGVALGGGTNAGVSVSGNGPISGGEVAVQIFGDSNIDISIDENVSLAGAGEKGVHIGGATNDNISISGNGAISGPFFGVFIGGGENSSVSVDGNGPAPISGGEGAVQIFGDSNSDISVSGNESIDGGFVGVRIDGDGISNVSVSGNGEITGSFGGVGIEGLSLDSISVSGNASISSAGGNGVEIGGSSLSNISISGNGEITANDQGVGIGGSSLSNISIDNNDLVTGGEFGIALGGPAVNLVSDISVSGNGQVGGPGTNAAGLGIHTSAVTNIADIFVDNNGSVFGIQLGGWPATPASISNISISGNGSIIGSFSLVGSSVSGIFVNGNGQGGGPATDDARLGINSSAVTNISVDNNASFIGVRISGLEIPGDGDSPSDSISNVSVSGNDDVSGDVHIYGVSINGIFIDNNVSVCCGVGIDGVNISNVSVSGNDSISGGGGVSVSGQTNDGVSIIGNGIAAGVGIVVQGQVSSSRLLIAGNRVDSDFVGIAVFGANPTGPRNVVLANDVQASTPAAAFGILLLAAERNVVAFNRVEGFAGEMEIDPGPPPILVGGGIGVILESSRNLILRNVVDSDPDLFWDETGSGNRWIRNRCDTSQPPGLC